MDIITIGQDSSYSLTTHSNALMLLRSHCEPFQFITGLAANLIQRPNPPSNSCITTIESVGFVGFLMVDQGNTKGLDYIPLSP
jgi:hypothetical protein